MEMCIGQYDRHFHGDYGYRGSRLSFSLIQIRSCLTVIPAFLLLVSWGSNEDGDD